MSIPLTAPVVVAIVGLVVYALPLAPKPNEVGRLMLFAGMLAALLGLR